MKPYDINTIADYIILRLTSDEENTLINLKLQKLLYYLQAWSLGINNERFLNCEFEAWVHGPVSRDLYNRFKASKTLYSFISKMMLTKKTRRIWGLTKKIKTLSIISLTIMLVFRELNWKL